MRGATGGAGNPTPLLTPRQRRGVAVRVRQHLGAQHAEGLGHQAEPAARPVNRPAAFARAVNRGPIAPLRPFRLSDRPQQRELRAFGQQQARAEQQRQQQIADARRFLVGAGDSPAHVKRYTDEYLLQIRPLARQAMLSNIRAAALGPNLAGKFVVGAGSFVKNFPAGVIALGGAAGKDVADVTVGRPEHATHLYKTAVKPLAHSYGKLIRHPVRAFNEDPFGQTLNIFGAASLGVGRAATLTDAARLARAEGASGGAAAASATRAALTRPYRPRPIEWQVNGERVTKAGSRNALANIAQRLHARRFADTGEALSNLQPHVFGKALEAQERIGSHEARIGRTLSRQQEVEQRLANAPAGELGRYHGGKLRAVKGRLRIARHVLSDPEQMAADIASMRRRAVGNPELARQAVGERVAYEERAAKIAERLPQLHERMLETGNRYDEAAHAYRNSRSEATRLEATDARAEYVAARAAFQDAVQYGSPELHRARAALAKAAEAHLANPRPALRTAVEKSGGVVAKRENLLEQATTTDRAGNETSRLPEERQAYRLGARRLELEHGARGLETPLQELERLQRDQQHLERLGGSKTAGKVAMGHTLLARIEKIRAKRNLAPHDVEELRGLKAQYDAFLNSVGKQVDVLGARTVNDLYAKPPRRVFKGTPARPAGEPALAGHTPATAAAEIGRLQTLHGKLVENYLHATRGEHLMGPGKTLEDKIRLTPDEARVQREENVVKGLQRKAEAGQRVRGGHRALRQERVRGTVKSRIIEQAVANIERTVEKHAAAGDTSARAALESFRHKERLQRFVNSHAEAAIFGEPPAPLSREAFANAYLMHGTTKEAARAIEQEGKLRAPIGERPVSLTSSEKVATHYGKEGAVALVRREHVPAGSRGLEQGTHVEAHGALPVEHVLHDVSKGVYESYLEKFGVPLREVGGVPARAATVEEKAIPGERPGFSAAGVQRVRGDAARVDQRLQHAAALDYAASRVGDELRKLTEPAAKGIGGVKPAQRYLELLRSEGVRTDRIAALKQQMIEAGKVAQDEGGFYVPARDLSDVKRAPKAQQQVSAMGLGPGNRRLSSLDNEYLGHLERSGRLRYDTTRLVAESLKEATRLTAIEHGFNLMWGMAKPTRGEAGGERYAIPIRASRTIPPKLKQMVNRLHAAGYLDGEVDGVLAPTELNALRDYLFPPKETVDRASNLTRDGVPVRWIDERVAHAFVREFRPRGAMKAALDAINNPFRAATLYTKPAYALNLLQGLGTAALQQTIFLPSNLLDTFRLMRSSDTELQQAVFALAGEGLSHAIGENVEGWLGHSIRASSDWWNVVVDRLPRVSAIVHEAKVMGYKGPEGLRSLVLDPQNREHLYQIEERGSREMVDYHMAPWERDTLRRVFFFYPWMRGATLWSLRFPVEHPAEAAFFNEESKAPGARARRLLGEVPSYLEGLFPVGHGEAVNLANLNNFASAKDALGGIGSLGRARSVGADKLAGELGPVSAFLYTLASGKSTLGRDLPQDESHLGGAFQQLYGGLPPAVFARRFSKGAEQHTNPAKQSVYREGGGSFLERLKTAAEPYMIGGLAPRPVNQPAMRAKAETEKVGAMGPAERLDYRYSEALAQLHDLHGHLRGEAPPPNVVRQALDLDHARAAAYLQTAKRRGVSTDELSPADKVRATGDALARHGYVSERDVANAVRYLQGVPTFARVNGRLVAARKQEATKITRTWWEKAGPGGYGAGVILRAWKRALSDAGHKYAGGG